LLALLKTLNRIGFVNLSYFILYKFFYKLSLLNFFLNKSKYTYGEIFFNPTFHRIDVSDINKSSIINSADLILKNHLSFFSYHNIKMDDHPDWFLDPFLGIHFSNFENKWTKLDDFSNKNGDIKNIWEPSRFNWIVTLSMAYSITNEKKYLNKMNTWLTSWIKNNPKHQGPNWKCAQETSIRLLNLLIANIVTKEDASNDMIELFKEHLERISLTTYYSKAQDNNHVISESIALYLGGYIIYKHTKDKKFHDYHKKGLKLIEQYVNKLIMDDGTFSQYSIIYHRMLLDLLSILESIRIKWILPEFSKSFYIKVSSAINWYCELIDEVSFDAPNIGANDGTYISNYTNMNYRDFRPTASFASSVFNYQIKSELWKNHPLIEIFALNKPKLYKAVPKSLFFNKGGLVKLINKSGTAFFRIPNFMFRPSHSDALHIDIWKDGKNWIRDAGSYSYAVENSVLDKFSGTKGHSTIQFDSSNQMPRLTRFLFGDWLKPSIMQFNEEKNSAISGYIDQNKNFHKREISSHQNGWDIIDEIDGRFDIAELRFILKSGNWIINNYEIHQKPFSLKVVSDDIQSFKIESTDISHYYMEKHVSPELIVKINKPSIIHTSIRYLD